eukprot:8084886-Pyramimonas_sp.AAC.1
MLSRRGQAGHLHQVSRGRSWAGRVWSKVKINVRRPGAPLAAGWAAIRISDVTLVLTAGKRR